MIAVFKHNFYKSPTTLSDLGPSYCYTSILSPSSGQKGKPNKRLAECASWVSCISLKRFTSSGLHGLEYQKIVK
jgi:hypothetical protein